MGGVVAVQVADLAAADAEGELAARAEAGLDAGPGRDRVGDLLARGGGTRLSVGRSKLQVQVNLKSRPDCACPDGRPLTIGEVARRSGVAASALRFYEERGLIVSERAGSGHRRYPRSVLRRIAFIVFAQRVGLTLDEIGAELAKLPPRAAPTRRDWSRLSARWTPGSTSGSPSCSG